MTGVQTCALPIWRSEVERERGRVAAAGMERTRVWGERRAPGLLYRGSRGGEEATEVASGRWRIKATATGGRKEAEGEKWAEAGPVWVRGKGEEDGLRPFPVFFLLLLLFFSGNKGEKEEREKQK